MHKIANEHASEALRAALGLKKRRCRLCQAAEFDPFVRSLPRTHDPHAFRVRHLRPSSRRAQHGGCLHIGRLPLESNRRAGGCSALKQGQYLPQGHERGPIEL